MGDVVKLVPRPSFSSASMGPEEPEINVIYERKFFLPGTICPICQLRQARFEAIAVERGKPCARDNIIPCCESIRCHKRARLRLSKKHEDSKKETPRCQDQKS